MISEIVKALEASLKLQMPGIVDLVNTEYAAVNGATIAAPKTYLRWIRSDILDRPANQMPVMAFGVYARHTNEEWNKGASTVRYPFMVQVWLADRDEEKLGDMASNYSDALDYWVQEYGSKLHRGLKAPEAAELDISNSEPDGAGFYRIIVQASGEFLITR